MFEDSLVGSRVGEVSSSRRWATLASIGLQVVVAGVVIALPLLHPEAVPFRLEAPKVWMPLIPKPPVPVVQVQRGPSASSSSSMAAQIATRPLILTTLPPSTQTAVADVPPLAPFGSGMSMSDGGPNGIGIGVGDGHLPVVSVAPVKAPVGRLRVSSGVSEGMLIAPIRPVYPMIAKAARVQGTVVVEAIISRTGTIESLRVVSGPPMLQNAALEAIREARYQPYRLNGEPTEVETRITVNFRMGG
jgi:periplasmic protein TonB